MPTMQGIHCTTSSRTFTLAHVQVLNLQSPVFLNKRGNSDCKHSSYLAFFLQCSDSLPIQSMRKSWFPQMNSCRKSTRRSPPTRSLANLMYLAGNLVEKFYIWLYDIHIYISYIYIYIIYTHNELRLRWAVFLSLWHLLCSQEPLEPVMKVPDSQLQIMAKICWWSVVN